MTRPHRPYPTPRNPARSLIQSVVLAVAAFGLAGVTFADDGLINVDGEAIPRPRIALIIDDLGYELEAGRRTVSLPGPVACAVLPATPRGRQLAELAAAGELATEAPIGLSRLALFGAMNSTVEWFDPERGNVDQLADVITNQFWNGIGR